jgi:hypothetical protein
MGSSLGKVLWLAAAVAATVGHGGCATPAPTQHGMFVEGWAQRLDYMGLVPVIPMTEDLRVGDMFVFSVNPEGAKSSQERRAVASEVAASTRWGSLPVLSALDQEYAQRPSWPRTPDVFMRQAPGDVTGPWDEPRTQGDRSVFATNEVPSRLRIVGLETFTTHSFSGTNLEPMIPTEAATLIPGLATSDNLAITLRVGSAESYALSMDELISLLTEPAEPGETAVPAVTDESMAVQAAAPAPRFRIRQPYRDGLEFFGDTTSNRAWLHVISEVVYVRSADVSIRMKHETPKDDEVTAPELAQAAQPLAASAAPAEAATAEAAPTDGEQPAAADETPADTPEVDSGVKTYVATQLDPVYGAFVRARAINDVLREMGVNDQPNGTVRYLTVTDESVALRRVWSRGLAIGVRGLFLEVDTTTGNVMSAGPARWPIGITTQQ